MSEPKLVSIIIVNWNGKHHLQKCLPSIYSNGYKRIEVIIVDNSSSDGSQEFIRTEFPQVKLVVNTSNEGFAKTNNIGIKVSSGEYVLFLNNDTLVTPNFLVELLKSIEENPLIGCVQAKILWMSKKTHLDSIGAFLTMTGFLYHYRYLCPDEKKYDKRINLFSAKGACMLIRRKVLEKVGLFDEDFFAYYEETDLCHRIWISGYKVVYEPKSVIYHSIGGTSNGMDNAFIQYHSFKNRVCSLIKNLSLVYLLQILPLHLILYQCAALGYLLQGRIAVCMALQRGLWWNTVHLSETLVKRRVIQSTMRTSKEYEILAPLIVHPPISYYISLLRTGLRGYHDEILL